MRCCGKARRARDACCLRRRTRPDDWATPVPRVTRGSYSEQPGAPDSGSAYIRSPRSAECPNPSRWPHSWAMIVQAVRLGGAGHGAHQALALQQAGDVHGLAAQAIGGEQLELARGPAQID